jgi:hypothetical protein
MPQRFDEYVLSLHVMGHQLVAPNKINNSLLRFFCKSFNWFNFFLYQRKQFIVGRNSPVRMAVG